MFVYMSINTEKWKQKQIWSAKVKFKNFHNLLCKKEPICITLIQMPEIGPCQSERGTKHRQKNELNWSSQVVICPLEYCNKQNIYL